MASGIRAAANRPKRPKYQTGASKEKRFKNTTEAQKKYHEAIAIRRAKKLKKNRK
jgi:hypothetical protein